MEPTWDDTRSALDRGRGSRAQHRDVALVTSEPSFLAIRQVKIPVTDLQRSADWYRAMFDLLLVREFVEDGELAGVALVDRSVSYVIGLRLSDRVHGAPDLAGFDLVSIAVAGRDDLVAALARADALGVRHGDINDRGPDGYQVDVTDPDGLEVRLLTLPDTDAMQFMGLSFSSSGTPEPYTTPRLREAGHGKI